MEEEKDKKKENVLTTALTKILERRLKIDIKTLAQVCSQEYDSLVKEGRIKPQNTKQETDIEKEFRIVKEEYLELIKKLLTINS